MSDQVEQTSIEPTDKQNVFVAEYLLCLNGAEAARRAGVPEKSARQYATETMSKPYIRALIDAGLKEKHLTINEVLARLADQAQGSLEEFVTPAGRGFRFDMKKAREAGKMHLIKSITKGPRGTRIELYDAQAALVHIGKHLGLFKEIHEGKVDIVNMSIAEWKAAQAARQEQADQSAAVVEEDEMCSTPSAPSS